MIDPVSLLLTAAGAGAVGSLHCAAMCGPLALAGSVRDGKVSPRATLSYVTGRFTGYAAVGALMGFLGQHALCLLPVASAQLVAVLLVAGLAAWRGLSILRPRLVTLRRRPPRRLSAVFAHLPRRGFGLGVATAVLPCGLLLPAWALATASGHAAWGALVMLVFAAASLPGLIVPVVGHGVLSRLNARIPARVQGAAWLALALWVVVRGFMGSNHCGM